MSRVHHLALGARDVARVAEFYREAFELSEVARHHDAGGRLRSIWLELGAGAVLMVERTELERAAREGVDAGWFLLAFSIEPDERAGFEQRLAAAGAAIEQRTEYSSYCRDPEGNRVAISHYPAK